MIYARHRTGSPVEELEGQLGAMVHFCTKNEWRLTQQYVDRAVPGVSGRDEFERLFRDAADRRFGMVLFWSLTQFSRVGTPETLDYLVRLDDCGAGWRSFTEPYLDSSGDFREAVLAVFSILAAHDRAIMSERTMDGLENARAQGRSGGRPRVQCDLDEVERLRKAGMSLTEIAGRVGVSRSSVHRILRSE